MSVYIKIIVALALLIAGYFAYNHAYTQGQKAGSAVTQAAWDKDKAQIQATTAAMIAANTKATEAALAQNEVISNEYQAKLSAANASALEFAERLHDVEAGIAAHCNTQPKAGDGSGAPSTSTPIGSDSARQLVTLVTALRTECAANADQLDALIGEIKPQL